MKHIPLATPLPPREGLNYIAGQWIQACRAETYEVRNPAALDEVTGVFPLSTEEDVAAAITAAQAAYPAWKATPPLQRAALLKRALEAMTRRADEIAQTITLENGKTLREARTEVDGAITEMEFQIHEGVRLYGDLVPSQQAGVMAFTRREPLGVVALISPWNFPFNVPVRKSVPALMAGNTCVFKPASLTPATGLLWAELLAEAGLPAGVFNCLIGAGGAMGEKLATHPAIRAISFTGSTQVGIRLNESVAANLTRMQLELGGKSPTLVLADADLDLAVNATVRAAFACAGQWCTSTSRVLVEQKIAAEFTERLVERTRQLRLGPGNEPATEMGPVCGMQQLQNILAYIATGRQEGARLLTGGERATDERLARGAFITPTVFDQVRADMRIAQEEIFGPVLCLMEFEDLSDALQLANDIPYGLAASIFTRDLKAAHHFIESIEAGLTHVNMITAYKEPNLPFGGWKQSGHGLPEAGRTGIEFFSEIKSVYIQP